MTKEVIKKFSYPVFYLLALFFIYRFLQEVGFEIFKKVNWFRLSGSLIITTLSYLFFSYALFLYVTKSKLQIPFKQVFVATHKYILGKYIPGKVWQFSGIFGLLNQYFDKKHQSLISLSMFQIVSIVCGILVSAYAVGNVLGNFQWYIYLIFYLLIIAIWILLRSFRKIGSSTFYSAIFLTVGWILMGLGFYECFESLESKAISLSSAMVYPVSVGVGIVAVFTPGGLGVREVVAGFILKSSDFPDVAIIASALILMRVVTLMSEVLLTAIAWIFPWSKDADIETDFQSSDSSKTIL